MEIHKADLIYFCSINGKAVGPDWKAGTVSSYIEHITALKQNTQESVWTTDPGGDSDILVYTCLNKQTNKQLFRGLNYHFQEKRGGFVKIYSNSSHSTQFWGSNMKQNPCLGVDFCIMTKMCLGVYFKTAVHTCVHLHISEWPPGTIAWIWVS